MKRPLRILLCALAVGASLGLASCEGMDSDNVHVSASVGMYYGTSYYNPWGYGGYYPPPVVIPPGGYRPPPGGGGVRPPAGGGGARPTPMPTRPAGGGGRRR